LSLFSFDQILKVSNLKRDAKLMQTFEVLLNTSQLSMSIFTTNQDALYTTEKILSNDGRDDVSRHMQSITQLRII